MAEQDLDRNEQASPHKLQEARKRGQVAKSPDLAAAVAFFAAAVLMAFKGPDALSAVQALFKGLWSGVPHAAGNPGYWVQSTLRMGQDALWLLVPLLATLAVTAIVGAWMQTGPLFSPMALTPDWTRLNPAQGMKRIFSTRTLFDAFRSVLKLCILSAVLWWSIRDLGSALPILSMMPPHALTLELVKWVGGLVLKLAATLLLIGLLDGLYSFREFAKQMRMSRKELTDEHKQREGDPRIRARMRDLRKEMLKRVQSLRETRAASVVITNPTHVAVAVRYQHGEQRAPQVLAKGSGFLAAMIRQIARRHGVPVVRSPALARSIYADVALGHEVAPGHYAPLAQLLLWVERMRRPALAGAGAPAAMQGASR